MALNKYGSKEMAEDFLNCGNSLLDEAGREWANTHGYYIESKPDSGSGPKWGSGQ
jgi:hypothetical protein